MCIDSHIGFTDVSRTWKRDELQPFQTLFRAGLTDAVLTGHVLIDHLDQHHPATLSHAISSRLLRDELGFDGVLISDDLGMGAIRCEYTFEEAIALAIEVGVDIVLHANTELHHADMGRRTFNAIRQLVAAGRVSEERLEVSYRRIARLKNKLTIEGASK